MKYAIEFELPDNDVVLELIEHEWVRWGVWGYSGYAYAKPVACEKPDLSTMLFSERKELADKYEQWAKKNCVNDCALSVISYLCAFGYIPTLFNQSGTETLPSAQPEVRTQMSSADRISRQAAIDALDQIFDRCEEIEAHLPEGDPDRTGYKMYPDYMTVWKYLHQLPSAQPEVRTQMSSADRISRQAAIDAVCSVCGDTECNIFDPDNKAKLYCPEPYALSKLPSAEPERKTGQWEFIGDQMFRCSECRHTFTQKFLEGWRESVHEPLFPPHCPSCGSYNGGEQE